MPEPYLPEDEAVLYVLGELNTEQAREFKTRLAESAELRTLVRELEEGAVAVALASPVKQPPQKVWEAIEKSIAKETSANVITHLFQNSWLRNGWAVAACLAICLGLTLWVNRSRIESSSPALSVQTQIARLNNAPINIADTRPSIPDETEIARQLLRASEQDAARLHAQITGLQNQIDHLAQSLTHQQILLGETNRLKFVQLTSAANGGQTSAPVALSPELQRALAVAMAHELGWLPAANTNAPIEANSSTNLPMTTQAGVDFADFRPGTNNIPGTPKSFSAPENQSAQITPTPQAQTTPAPNTTVPAFISGNSLIMAIDSTIAAKGSQLTFVTSGAGQDQQVVGSTVMGDNPVVVTVPMGLSTDDGVLITPTGMSPWGMTVIFNGVGGTTNLFQYFVANPNSP